MNEMTQEKGFSLAPSSLDEAMKFSEIIAGSDLVPKDYKGRPGNVLVAIQMGQEVGLPPMQAVQNIAVINGRPSIWGDAIPAIIKNHPHYEWMKESFDEATMTATCVIKRKGDHEAVSTFSRSDAEGAGLWNKPGPWKSYPKRMLQMRARGFASRDAFPDALKGLSVAEGARDIEPITASQPTEPEARQALSPAYPDDQFSENVHSWADAINAGKTTAERVIKMISSKYTLSDEQKAVIYDLAPVDAEAG